MATRLTRKPAKPAARGNAEAAARAGLEAHIAGLEKAKSDLEHRLKAAEADREHWRSAAGYYAETLDAPDAEIAKLKRHRADDQADADGRAIRDAGKIASLESGLRDAKNTIAGMARLLGRLSEDVAEREWRDDSDYSRKIAAAEHAERRAARSGQAPRPTSDPVGFAGTEA